MLINRSFDKAEKPDFNAFKNNKTYLREKDEKLILSFSKEIIKTIKNRHGGLRILDIGSGEGSLVSGICKNLYAHMSENQNLQHVSIDCVEPCTGGISLITQLAKDVEKFNMSNICS